LSLATLRAGGRQIEELKARFAGTWDSVLAEADERRLAAEIVEANARLSERAHTAGIKGPERGADTRVESVNRAVDDAEEKNHVVFAASVRTRQEGTQRATGPGG